MKLFKKKEEPKELVKVYIKYGNDEMAEYYVTHPVADYIKTLENNIIKLYNCEKELNAIKPILTAEDYKPAISTECWRCKYVVKSKLSGAVIGCCKGNLCDDFEENRKDDQI